MKKLLMGVGFTVAALSFLPGSASAHSYEAKDSERGYSHASEVNTKKCDRIATRLEKLNSKFDQENERRLERQQRLIDRQNEEGCVPTGTIVDNLVENGNFKTLVTAVTAANLAAPLSEAGDKTVFAPTDQAFAALPAGTVEALVKDIPALTNILTQHVVAGGVNAETAAEAGMAKALNGNTLTFTKDDCQLMVNGVPVVLYDIKTTNGIIHVIDSVLLP